MKKRYTKKVIRKIEKNLAKSFIKFFNCFEPNFNNEYILPHAYDRDYPTLRARYDKLIDLSKEEIKILKELHVDLYLLLGWQLKLKPTWSKPYYVDGVNQLVLTKYSKKIIKIVSQVVWGTPDCLEIAPFEGKIIFNKNSKNIVSYNFLLGDEHQKFVINYCSRNIYHC
ncbi:MAG: hypothetical protein ACRCXZ_08480 [Patescibacteria group bacterium]